MRLISQEDSMGCAIACVAFVLNINYKEATQLFDFPEKRKTSGYRSSELRKALQKKEYGNFSKYVGRITKPILQSGDIVYVKKCVTFPCGHYLVKIARGYMDPFINLHEVGGDHRKAKAGKRLVLSEHITMIIRGKR